MQKGLHLVFGMYMLVGDEKKIMGWRNDMLGPGKKRWLTPAMHTYGTYILNDQIKSLKKN